MCVDHQTDNFFECECMSVCSVFTLLRFTHCRHDDEGWRLIWAEAWSEGAS